jgi:hypothetical protein
LAASGGQLLGFDATSHTWGPVDSVADINFFAEGVPSASKKVFRKVFARSARLFSDFTQSQASAGVAATAAATFNVYKNATLVGTIHFAIGATPRPSRPIPAPARRLGHPRRRRRPADPGLPVGRRHARRHRRHPQGRLI